MNIFFCNAFNLECNFKEKSSSSWTYVKSGKVCDVKNLVISSPNQQITSINGISGSNAIDNDVTALRVDGQTVNYFPRGLEKFFPNIEIMFVVDCKLKAITNQDLASFPQLKELRLSHNDIEELDDDLFAANKKLISISLSYNRIKFIGEVTFKPLKQLDFLFLNSNKCINKDAFFDVSKVNEIIDEVRKQCQSEIRMNDKIPNIANNLRVDFQTFFLLSMTFLYYLH
jgi:hypothetical protein